MDLFGTAGIRGSVTDTVTPTLALSVGRAAAVDGAEFVVARDGRETGPALAAAVEAGLESGGARVRRAGQLPTPALAYASQGRRGIMVTASHNPPTDNGLKLFVDGQEYDSIAENRIEERVADDPDPVEWNEWGDSTTVDVLSNYRETVIGYAEEFGSALDGLRVVVDCGNGTASVATPQVLRALGADVVALNASVDGHFPGRESKPTPETLEDLLEFVRAGEFDLGIGHDGDADRIVIVAEDGSIVHEDTVLAILAEHYVARSDVSDPVVVTTPNASARIDERVRAAGGRVERVHLGGLHEGIAEVRATAEEQGATDETSVVFAAEPWKHIHPALGGWIDGIASAAVFSRLVATDGLAALREPVTERPYRKVSIDCPDEHKGEVMATLEARLPEQFPEASVSTAYGVRLEWPDASWVLVRPSGTEPYVRLYAESDDVDALVEDANAVIERAVEETTT
ncbi:phosphopentomutase/phosphoglucosamine mutase [Halorientalis salina]|uniref:phosphopentomutase/phosphoglucosamine mutase n=1 Tax=Halorientalis salina TaxID=2932266 RepID=UPI0010AC788F|nr:phosphopentomutase/phosphoglucosamine mutase [Halorientalis salina]